MQDMRGMPSTWLLKNSKGFPDFLFTILTYSLILLAFVSLIWIAFGILSFVHAGSAKAQTLIEIMDNMKTGIMYSTGQYDPQTQTCTHKGTFSCPRTGEKDKKFKSKMQIVDDTTIIYTMYTFEKDGTKQKAMECTYTRK